jgi:hypothetical protein
MPTRAACLQQLEHLDCIGMEILVCARKGIIITNDEAEVGGQVVRDCVSDLVLRYPLSDG